MLLICRDKTIDLNKFETVTYAENIITRGYSVMATRNGRGFLGMSSLISEEIVCLKYEKDAEELVQDITRSWIKKKDVFDVAKWIKE